MLRGHEAAPIVADGTTFVVAPYPNPVFALDLTRPGAPLKWRHDPKPDAAAQGVACCDIVSRGPAYADGRLFFNTLDGHTVALDAATGRPLWKTKLGDINRGESMTMAPLVVKNHVLVGNSGGEFGVRGWIAALDTASGELRKVLFRPERNGFVYVIDRATGEVLSADPFAHVNSVAGVDLATGRPDHVEEKAPVLGEVVREICPMAAGAKDWEPSHFHP